MRKKIPLPSASAFCQQQHKLYSDEDIIRINFRPKKQMAVEFYENYDQNLIEKKHLPFSSVANLAH